MTRLLVIGMDGAAFPLMSEMIRKRETPVIGTMASEGTFAVLNSTIPPVTCPAWPSMVTGMNPGKHGLFDFINIVNGEMKIASSSAIRGYAVWDALTRLRKRSIVMNVPVTYPPYGINGMMVSGMLTPDGSNFLYPDEMRDELDRAAGGYVVECDLKRLKSDPYGTFKSVLEVDRKRVEAFKHMITRYKWDFSMIVLRATDIVPHFFWGRREVIECYRNVDRLVGEIVESAGDANILIVSDHGMGHVRYNVLLNQILFENGFLERSNAEIRDDRSDVMSGQKRRISVRDVLLGMGVTADRLKGLLRKLRLESLIDVLPSRLKSVIPYSRFEVNYSSSRAYCHHLSNTDNSSIYINPRFRDDDELKLEIIDLLKSLTDERGKPVVERVYTREEVYHGPHLDRAPDILFIFNEGFRKAAYFGESGLEPIKDTIESKPGGHRPKGIFIAIGPDVDRCRFKDISIIDVAPTVLKILKEPIPKYMDGNPICM